jgi:hypothetical protein
MAYQRIEHDHAPTADHLPARARIPGPDVARALADALGMEFAHTPHHERVLALAAALTHEVTFATPADLIALVRGLVMGSALARALAAVHDRRGAKRRRTSLQPLAETLAGTLVRRAGISEDYRVTVSLDTLADVLRRACAAFGGDREPADSWSAIVTRRLAETAEPVFTRRRPLSSVEPVILRLPALALAAEADRRRRPAAGTAFRTVAAGVTLMQRRATDRDRLETVLLARA